MSCPPVVRIDAALNQISTQIYQNEQNIYRSLGVIQIADKILRENMGISLEAAKCQMDALKQAMEQSKWNAESLRIDLNIRINELRSDLVSNYNSLLAARPAMILSDPSNASKMLMTQLDGQKRAELSREFEVRLDEKLNSIMDELQLDSYTNLEQLLQVLEENYKIQQDEFENAFQIKQELTEKESDLEAELRPILKELQEVKRKLLGELKVSDIFIACQVGNVEFVKDSINKTNWWTRKKFLNQTHQDGFTPLHVACYHGQVGIAKMLIEAGAELNIADRYGYRPIHWAAQRGAFATLKFLLQQIKIAINAKGEYDRTALHMSVYNGKIKSTHLLIKNGANINAQTKKENQNLTPLHHAVIRGNIAMVKELTQYPQLDVTIKDSEGHSPLYYAVTDGQSEIVKLLLNHSSWLNPFDPRDVNSLDYLLSVGKKRNYEAIDILLLSKYQHRVEQIK